MQSGNWVFTVGAEGTCYLIVDNTVAGQNTGSVGKSTTLGIIYSYGVSETSDLPGLSFLIMAGVFTVVVGVVSYLLGGRRKKD